MTKRAPSPRTCSVGFSVPLSRVLFSSSCGCIVVLDMIGRDIGPAKKQSGTMTMIKAIYEKRYISYEVRLPHIRSAVSSFLYSFVSDYHDCHQPIMPLLLEGLLNGWASVLLRSVSIMNQYYSHYLWTHNT